MYKLTVDHGRRRVVSCWYGNLTAAELLEYQQVVWQRPDVCGYDELLDVSCVAEIAVSGEDLGAIARVAAAMDDVQGPSRFAIVAPRPSHFGLARSYEAHRNVQDAACREVGVFHDLAAAIAWLDE